MPAYAELSQNGRRIQLWFRSSSVTHRELKLINGYRFVPEEKHPDGPFWSFPLDLEIGRRLRRLFGEELELGPGLTDWGHRTLRDRQTLRSIGTANSAELSRLPDLLPELYDSLHLGPKGRWMTDEEKALARQGPGSFQTADVKFMAEAMCPANFNQPGTGKTRETIGAVFEASLDLVGPLLVIAPKTALEGTWAEELESLQHLPVYLSTGTAKQKERAIASFMEEVVQGATGGWLVLNSDQIRSREEYHPCPVHDEMFDAIFFDSKQKRVMKKCDLEPACWVETIAPYPGLFDVLWGAVISDESHKEGIRNPNSLTGKGFRSLRVHPDGKRMALTATPQGGVLLNLWGLLNWLRPDAFRSKWRFAEHWCGVWKDSMGFRTMGTKLRTCEEHVGEEDMRPEDCDECRSIELAFYDMLSAYAVRRTKAEVLPWLPPKHYIPVWCDMTPKQRTQYQEFSRFAETVATSKTITAKNIMDEFTKLRQFSFGYHEWNGSRLMPTAESGKLVAMKQVLEELGIFEDSCEEQVVIGSQFSTVVEVIYQWLLAMGVPTAKITGAVAGKNQRRAIKDAFQAGGEIRVLVLTTTAGGVSLDLDRASNVFVVDETWNPDDQEQLEDRTHRASRIHQVNVWYFRSKETIEELVYDRNTEKSMTNFTVLDLQRIAQANAK